MNVGGPTLVMVGDRGYAFACADSLDGQLPYLSRHYDTFQLFLKDRNAGRINPLVFLYLPRGRGTITDEDRKHLGEIADANLQITAYYVTDGDLPQDLPKGVESIRPSSLKDLLKSSD